MNSTLKNHPSREILYSVLLFLVLLSLLTFALHSLTENNNLGSDYYIYYLAGRALFIDHQNPYSDQVAEQVQMAVYKHLAGPEEDQLGFAYPPYALLPSMPTFWLTYDWAQAFWISLNLLVLMSFIYLAFPQAPKWAAVSVLFIYPFSFALILGNYNLLVTAFLILVYGILIKGRPVGRPLQVGMGVLLAWSTVKPQFMWLFLIFLLVFAWRRRLWWLLVSFAAASVFMLAFSFAVLPAWPADWYDRLVKYTGYNQTWLILTFFLKEVMSLQLATVITTLAGVVFAALTAWLFYRWWKGGVSDLLMMAWCGFLIFLFHPRGKAYEHIPFLLPILLWICQKGKLPRPGWTVWVFWIGSLVMSWLIFILSRQPGVSPLLSESPFFLFIGWMAWLYIFERRSARKLMTGEEIHPMVD
jgi:hypothetical protein